jgi:hypothetical protein
MDSEEIHEWQDAVEEYAKHGFSPDFDEIRTPGVFEFQRNLPEVFKKWGIKPTEK